MDQEPLPERQIFFGLDLGLGTTNVWNFSFPLRIQYPVVAWIRVGDCGDGALGIVVVHETESASLAISLASSCLLRLLQDELRHDVNEQTLVVHVANELLRG